MFGPWDYFSFLFIILVTIAVGIYYSRTRKQPTEGQNASGGHIHPLLIVVSVVATCICPLMMVVFPVEVYVFGAEVAYNMIAYYFATFIYTEAFLPIIYELKMESVFEYLELRFNKSTRVFSSLCSSCLIIFYMSLVMFTSSMSLSVVTGFETEMICLLQIFLCVAYTAAGGFKAVVWSDFIQFIVLGGVIVASASVFTTAAGGFQEVWKSNLDSGRISPPNLSFDFTSRYTLWSAFLGFTVNFAADLTINQPINQRLIQMPTLRYSKIAFFAIVTVLFVVIMIVLYTGMALYGLFKDCDPISSFKIDKGDKLLPYAIMETVGQYPGLLGVFIAGIMSASLSTYSSCADSYALVMIEDYLPNQIKQKITPGQKKALHIAAVVLLGGLTIALVYAIRNNDSIFQVAISLFSICICGTFSLFFMGMIFPWISIKGALCGAISGVIFILWLCSGNMEASFSGKLIPETKRFTTSGCGLNSTTPEMTSNTTMVFSGVDNEEVFVLYRVSFMWYTTLGLLISVIVGLIISYVTGLNDITTVDPKLISPLVKNMIYKNRHLKKSVKEENPKETEMRLLEKTQILKNDQIT